MTRGTRLQLAFILKWNEVRLLRSVEFIKSIRTEHTTLLHIFVNWGKNSIRKVLNSMGEMKKNQQKKKMDSSL